MTRRNGALRLLPLLALALGAGAERLRAQTPPDTVLTIRPEARVPDSSARVALPPEIIQEVLRAYNDSLTTRIYGPFLLPRGSRHTGPIAVFRGSLRVSGDLVGRVTVINGDLILDGGATIAGDVLVVGGQIYVRPGGFLDGRRRAYRPQAYLVRTAAGLLVEREAPRTLGQIAAASASFTTGRFVNTLSIETGRTYNRVEGLPIVFGPTVVRSGLQNVEARLDLRAIAWTAPDRTDRRSNFGYSGRMEFHFGRERRLQTGVHVSRLISPIEDQPLSRSESGWSAFLLQRDYRDFFESQGVSGYAAYAAGKGLRLSAMVGRQSEKSVPANDPISIFRNGTWRPNPLVDDGHYTTWRAGLDYDTRNDAESPSNGWQVHGWVEHSWSDDASTLSFPAQVRDPIAPGRYSFSRFLLDARGYARLDPSVRAGLRVVAGGWIDGDPLPVQRRFGLGGPDRLPGYEFRSMNCAPASLTDPSRVALCDRLLAAQLEVRTRIRLGLPIATMDPYLSALQRLLGIREPDIVIFADGGKGWITGDGPGRVPNNRIPKLGEWSADLGLGFDAGGLGIYFAQPLTGPGSLTLTARLQRRF